MSIKERTINIDIMTKGYTKLKYKQGDSNQILNFKFYKNGSELDLTGYVAGIFYEKPNNEILEKTGNISSNTVTTTITSGVLNTAGVVKTEIFLTKDTEVAISFTILIEIESSIDKNSAVQEKEEWDVIRDLLINGNNVSMIDDTSTATNKTWSSSKIDSQIKDIEEKINEPNHYYVGKNQKYTTINQAINKWIQDGKIKSIIHISKGEYNEVLSINGNANLTLEGENKYDCLIITKRGYYKDSPVVIQGGDAVVRNLTIVADHSDNPDYSYIGLETGSPMTDDIGGAYAIHIDDEGKGTTVVENCILISYQNSAVGMGTHQSQHVTFKNCDMYSYTPSDYPSQAGDNGAFLIHSKFGNDVTNQKLTLCNCNLFSENFKAFNYYDYSQNNGCEVDLEFINCNFRSNATSIDKRWKLVNITKVYAGDITKNCYGNNVDKLNYVYENENLYGQIAILTNDNGTTIRYTDCNLAIKTGFWNVPYNGSNLPAIGRQFDGMTVAYDSNYSVQYAWDTTQTWMKYKRYCSNGTWSTWSQVRESNDELLKLMNQRLVIGNTGTCESISNLNSVAVTGFYLCNGSDTDANCPTAAFCGCLTICFNSSYKVQYSWELNTGNKYKRNMINGTWGSWSAVSE